LVFAYYAVLPHSACYSKAETKKTPHQIADNDDDEGENEEQEMMKRDTGMYKTKVKY